MKSILTTLASIFLFSGFLLSQEADTIQARLFTEKANESVKKNQFDSVAFYFSKAAEIYEQEEDWLNCVKNYRLTARAFNHHSKSDTAMYFSDKALKIADEYFVKNTKGEIIERVDNYIIQGEIHYKLGNYKQELRSFKKALGILIKSDYTDSLKISEIWYNMGAAYDDLGEYENAIEYCKKSLNLKQTAIGNHDVDIAVNIDKLGDLYSNTGQYEKAHEYYQKALLYKINSNGEYDISVAYSYNKIGSLYLKQRNNDSGLEYLQKALKINIKEYGEIHPSIAHNYQGIGIVYKEKMDNDKALEYFEKALKINKEIFGGNHIYVASNYNNMGNIYRNEGDYDKAFEFLNKTLLICIDYYGMHHPRVALIYHNIGVLYAKVNKLHEALNYFQYSISANLIDFNDTIIYNNPKNLNALSEPFLINFLNKKAETFYLIFNKEKNIRDIEAAISTYDLVYKLAQKMRSEYTHEKTKLLLSKTTRSFYAGAVKAAMTYGDIIFTNESKNKAFEYIEKSKSSTISAHLNNINIKQYLHINDSLLKAEKEIIESRVNFETKIQIEKSRKGGYDTLLLREYQESLFYYSQKYDALLITLKQEYSDYFNLKYRQVVAEIENIQKNLDSKSALINYFMADTSVIIALVTKDKLIYETVPIDSMFEQKILDYHIDIKTDFSKKELKNSILLYNTLIKPIEQYIKNKKHLIIIPDENLYYLPFETLCKEGKFDTDPLSVDFLIKIYSISYHYSASLWLNSKEKTNLNSFNKNFLGFAPIFDPKNENGYILSYNWISDTTDVDLATRSISSDIKRFNYLEHSEKEIATIIELFNAKDQTAKGFFHSEANEQNFKNAIKNYNYVHVASHSFANDQYPALSGIAFSQPDTSVTNTEHSDDGILYAGETYNLNLKNTDLVVLSSCKSGLGKLIQGEGFLSLSRGFLYSGTPNIIFSLWNVKDEQTKDLMTNFYSNILKGKDYSNALRSSKLKMLKNKKTANPKYWASWILIGR